MRLEITYEQALREYPKEVDEIIRKIRKGRSKHKNAAPETLTWEFNWGVRIDACSFEDILSGKAHADQRREAEKTIDEKVNDYASRCSVILQAWREKMFAGSERLEPVPSQILAQYRKQLEKTLEEQTRFNDLTPKEQQEELEDLIDQLRGPGFVALSVPIPPK